MAKIVQYPGSGCVVEFMQGNEPQIAWVLEEQGGKLRLLLPNRREMPLPSSRLLPWAGPQYPSGKSREEIVGILNEVKEKRERLEQAADPVELWEMAQGEVDKASVLWLAELVYSDPDVDSIAALGHAVLACKSHFRFNPPDFEIYTAEAVEVRKQAEDAAKEREALVGGGAAWFKTLWDARQSRKPVPDPDKNAPPEPVRSRLIRMLNSRILDPQSQEDEALWKQVVKGLPDDPHLPLLLSISWGLVPEHYNYWLARAEYAPGDSWSEAFSGEVEAVLGALAAGKQLPLDEAFISIDSASTRDIDDAFQISAHPEGGWNVSVALACPAFAWPFGSELDKAVFGRATSLYLPEGSYHMMPQRLGTEAFSLHAGQDAPSMLVRCRVAPDGTILEAAPEQAWVRLAANLAYSDCEAVLDGTAGADNPACPYAESLKAALSLAQARQLRRVEQGAVIIERPDVDFYLVGEGAATEVFLKEIPPAPQAQFLVQEMMILANAALAEWGLQKELPLLFRTQDLVLPPEFAGVWTSPPDIARIVKSMAAASLELEPRPHAGMGLKSYITATSPLRRYPDLVNEAQVIHFLQTGSPRWNKAELGSLLAALSLNLEAAGLVQRFRPRYWKLLYVMQQAAKHGDACIWEATVSEVNDAFVSLSLEREQLFVRGKRHLFGDKVFPGQKFLLRLSKINPLRGEFSIMAAKEMEESKPGTPESANG